MKLLSRVQHRLQPTRLLRPWDFPGKSTGVGCHCLLPLPWPLGKPILRTFSSHSRWMCPLAAQASLPLHGVWGQGPRMGPAACSTAGSFPPAAPSPVPGQTPACSPACPRHLPLLTWSQAPSSLRPRVWTGGAKGSLGSGFGTWWRAAVRYSLHLAADPQAPLLLAPCLAALGGTLAS